MLKTKFDKLLQALCLNIKKVFRLDQNTNHLDTDYTTTMAQREVRLTQEEYDYIIKKWPSAKPAIIKRSRPGVDTFYETEVRKISNEEVPQGCIDYVQALKAKKNPTNKPHKSEKSKRQLDPQHKPSQIGDSNSESKSEEKISNTGANTSLQEPDADDLVEDKVDIQTKSETSDIQTPCYYYIDPPKLSREEYPVSSTNWNWNGISDYVVGSSHLKSNPPIPCQDTALATILNRPIILVSDGAGSCKLSHFGSNIVVRNLAHFINEQQQLNSRLLDLDNPDIFDTPKSYADQIIKHSIEALRSEAESKHDTLSSFRCTLSIVIIGRKKSFWLRVGDSPIIIQTTKSTNLIGSVNKGEYANQTSFLSEELSDEKIQYGLVDMENVKGFCVLSDGTAEKLMRSDGSEIARAVPTLLDALGLGKLEDIDLHDFLSNPEWWSKTTGDDKSFAAFAIQG